MKRLTLVFAAVIVLFTASAAYATVTFDPSTGTGFVGKGDIQEFFGWNNKTFQNNANGVTFSFFSTDTYRATCTWVTDEGTAEEQTHDIDRLTSTLVERNIVRESRMNSKGKQGDITGFKLTGFGSQTTTGNVPVVGGSCLGSDGADGTWTSVELISSSGGLYVNYGGNSYFLQ